MIGLNHPIKSIHFSFFKKTSNVEFNIEDEVFKSVVIKYGKTMPK